MLTIKLETAETKQLHKVLSELRIYRNGFQSEIIV